MNRLKDFLYDKNDIVLSLVILVLAGLLIAWRMDAIMNYPSTLAKETHTTTTTQSEVTEESDAADDNKHKNVSNSNQDNNSLWNNGALTKDVQVTIQGGSASAAVESLVNVNLFDSYDQFVQICNAAGYNPESIKATTYTFSKGCTQTDIAKQITQ